MSNSIFPAVAFASDVSRAILSMEVVFSMGIRQSSAIRIVRRSATVPISMSVETQPGTMEFAPRSEMGEYLRSEIRDMFDADASGWDENIISESSHKKQYYREPETPRILSAKHHEELRNLMEKTCYLTELRGSEFMLPMKANALYIAQIPLGKGWQLEVSNAEYRDTGEPDFITAFHFEKRGESGTYFPAMSVSIGQHAYYDLYDFRYKENRKLLDERQRDRFLTLLDRIFTNPAVLGSLGKG
jgi:hypothetical protein